MPNCKTAKVTDAASQKCAINARSENDMNSNTNTDSHFEANERQHSEVDYNADLDAAFCDAVKCFMRICNGGDSKKENKALHGFGQMIIATISEMNIAKQAKVMSLVTEAVMQMKMEDDGYNEMTKT